MRKPKPRVALISLAAAITVSAVATVVLETSAFPARDDPKAKEAYDQGYAWVKARTEPEPDPATSPAPSPSPTAAPTPSPSPSTKQPYPLQSPSLTTEIPTDTITLRARTVGEAGEADYREICHSYVSTPEYTGALPAKYRSDWVRGCQAALTRKAEGGPRTK
ncbi:hypothetical protein [Streptomyces sp. NPDC047525]|uniref:hypothetical protein n=1 Tax=Streptomyces sp. NPDC047525 TaxID=3155264 RepID=UPI0033F765A1